MTACNSDSANVGAEIVVTPFDVDVHLAQMEKLVQAAQRDLTTVYPPARGYAAVHGGDVTSWILDGDPVQHWVALIGDRVVGSARIASPGPYLGPDVGLVTAKGMTVEVQRVLVDPDVRGRGTGRALISHVQGYAHLHELTLVLAVFDYLTAARALYTSVGFVSVGRFIGANGLTHVMVYAVQDELPHV